MKFFFNSSIFLQELKKILNFTCFNDSDLQLKQSYVERCKRLSTFGYTLYSVREVLQGRRKKKVFRLATKYNYLVLSIY